MKFVNEQDGMITMGDEQINLLILAAREFVERCERGEIRSKYTYGKFKEILLTLDLEERNKHISK